MSTLLNNEALLTPPRVIDPCEVRSTLIAQEMRDPVAKPSYVFENELDSDREFYGRTPYQSADEHEIETKAALMAGMAISIAQQSYDFATPPSFYIGNPFNDPVKNRALEKLATIADRWLDITV
ncbi:MAG: hypothetical protein JWP13_575 [Candidatus Saccharibacteria bacterium]|nr:hypothetical protein [Candidatus Saccharibacteria bacterium]